MTMRITMTVPAEKRVFFNGLLVQGGGRYLFAPSRWEGATVVQFEMNVEQYAEFQRAWTRATTPIVEKSTSLTQRMVRKVKGRLLAMKQVMLKTV
jgi:hypothetical protein